MGCCPSSNDTFSSAQTFNCWKVILYYILYKNGRLQQIKMSLVNAITMLDSAWEYLLLQKNDATIWRYYVTFWRHWLYFQYWDQMFTFTYNRFTPTNQSHLRGSILFVQSQQNNVRKLFQRSVWKWTDFDNCFKTLWKSKPEKPCSKSAK